MSGGHWDYKGFTIKDTLEEIARDPQIQRRFPRLAKILPHLGETLYQMEHELDWDFSGDSMIPNDKAFEGLVLGRLQADLDLGK